MPPTVDSASYAYPSLNAGPLMYSARAAVDAARQLGVGELATAVRARSVPYIFDGMASVFASGAPPAPALVELFDRLAAAFSKSAGGNVLPIEAKLRREPGTDENVAQITGELYGRLFREFPSAWFWDEPVQLLRQRLERNGVASERWVGKSVLDAGCGGGRYTVAWRQLEAASVIGLDVSTLGINDGRTRVREAAVDNVEFQSGSVLSLPFADNRFDVVYSNGVLHHTIDWRTGIQEIVRVLRRGGLGWLYLIENPGGFYWDLIEILRAIMRDDDPDDAQRVLVSLGLPANRIFFMLDHVMVPINERLTPAEVEDALKDAGAIDIRRLNRGADFDRVEALHRGDPYAEEKYGVGENRYVFSKA